MWVERLSERRSIPFPRSPTLAGMRVPGCTSTPRTPLGVGLSRALLVAGRRRASRLPGRQCTPVVLHANGLLAALVERARRPSLGLQLVPEYLRTNDEVDSLSDYGPALGRRFRSLKLWALLRCYGRAGLQSRIREAVRLADLFEGWVRDEPGWEVCAPRHFSLVCFRREGSDAENDAMVDRVNRSGELFLSHTRLDGRYVLRLAVGNERTTEKDLERAWVALREV
jgi:pyridoxal-dependent decarboxylase-like protein